MEIETAFRGISIILGLGALWFGLFQYRAANTWKRIEYTASVLDKINSDPDLRLAITFLDWREREISIPSRFTPTDPQKSFTHTHAKLAQAFDLDSREKLEETGQLDLKKEFLTPEFIMYVEIFDRFFDYMVQLDQFIKNGLVAREDVQIINYWAKRVNDLKFNGKPIFENYLEYYNYKSVIDLASEIP